MRAAVALNPDRTEIVLSAGDFPTDRFVLQGIADEGAPPISTELRRVLSEARLGRPLEESLVEMCERLGSDDLLYVATAVEVSAYSFKSLAMACKPLLGRGSSLVGMDFDNTVAWPGYDWMGVAKAALEATTRYLARDLGPEGIRANLVAAGPVRTMAAKSIPGFSAFEDAWDGRAPLGWNVDDPVPVAKTVCALLSDWLPVTTGSMVWADGGFHAIGV